MKKKYFSIPILATVVASTVLSTSCAFNLKWTTNETATTDLKFDSENFVIGLNESFNSKTLSIPFYRSEGIPIKGIKFDTTDTGLTSPKKSLIEEVWFPNKVNDGDKFQLWGNFFQGMNNLRKVVYGTAAYDVTNPLWGRAADGYQDGWTADQATAFTPKFDLFICWLPEKNTSGEYLPWFYYGNWSPYGVNIKNLYILSGQDPSLFVEVANTTGQKVTNKILTKEMIKFFNFNK